MASEREKERERNYSAEAAKCTDITFQVANWSWSSYKYKRNKESWNDKEAEKKLCGKIAKEISHTVKDRESERSLSCNRESERASERANISFFPPVTIHTIVNHNNLLEKERTHFSYMSLLCVYMSVIRSRFSNNQANGQIFLFFFFLFVLFLLDIRIEGGVQAKGQQQHQQQQQRLQWKILHVWN